MHRSDAPPHFIPPEAARFCARNEAGGGAGEPPPINDVAWSSASGNCFAAAADGGATLLWDSRCPAASGPAAAAQAGGNALSVSWHADSREHLLATGSSDYGVRVWDVRRLERPLHRIGAHHAAVKRVAWNPDLPGVLATADGDGKVMIWDVDKLPGSDAGNTSGVAHGEGTGERAGPGPGAHRPKVGSKRKHAQPDLPSGMLFVHAGHVSAVEDVNWALSGADPLMLASVSSLCGEGDEPLQDNIVQFWRPDL